MFEDGCYKKGVACERCAARLRAIPTLDALKAETEAAGVDARHALTVKAMWLTSVREPAPAAPAAPAAPDEGRARPSGRDGFSRRGGGVAKKARPADRLGEIAGRHGVRSAAAAGPSRASVVRECLKRVHPDKKGLAYGPDDERDYFYLVGELKKSR